MIVPDTNVLIGLLHGRAPRTWVRMRELPPAEIGVPAVVRAELMFGARNSSRVDANLTLLQTFLAPFAALPFDDRCADDYGIIRADLASAGTPICPMDTLIAATARANDATLITRNGREFARVPGLRWADWETP